MRTISIALAAVIALSGSVRAQCVDQAADDGREGVKTQPALSPLPVRLTADALSWPVPPVWILNGIHLPLEAAPTPAEIALTQSGRNTERDWPARHPVLLGTLMGLGVGAAIGAATCAYPGAEGPCSYYTFPGNVRALGALTIGGVGAGIGAVVGAIVGARLR